MNLLIQFLLRLSFGLAAGMAITSSKKVTSGYFRNNLYVMLGLTTLATVASYAVGSDVFLDCLAATVASYVGSVCFLYEKTRLGRNVLIILALLSFVGALRHTLLSYEEKDRSQLENRYNIDDDIDLAKVDVQKNENFSWWEARAAGTLVITSVITSGLLLGMTMAAMLLGHWYLNTPTMELVPLRRLIIAMGVAVALQAIVSILGLWGELTYANEITTQWWLFLLLRWLFGIVGVAILAWMAWETLKIPNTQSATGILYVAVIGTFVGETMALLLSRESLFPL